MAARGFIKAANITTGPQVETWVLDSGIHVPFSVIRAMNDAGAPVDVKSTNGGALRVNVENTVAIAEPIDISEPVDVNILGEPLDVNIVSGGGGGGVASDVNVLNFPSSQAVTGPLTDTQLRASSLVTTSRFTGGSHFRKSVAAAGAPEQLQTGSQTCQGVKVIALPDNTGRIVVGLDNSVRAGQTTFEGLESLYAEDSVFLAIDNVNKIWIDASVSGNGVSYAYLT